MAKALTVAIAQINTTVGDLDGNLAKMKDFLARARRAGVDLLLFPELAITGYPPEDLLFKKSFVDANLRSLRALARLAHSLSVFVGFVDRDSQGKIYNAAAFIRNGRIERVYRKMELPNYGVFDEKRYFSRGLQPETVMLRGVSIGLSICEDIWQKESFVYQKGYYKNIQLLLNISASPYHVGKQSQREALLRDLARKTGCFIAYQNLVGGQDELVFDGGSRVLGPRGELLAAAKNFEEDFIVSRIGRASSSRGISFPKKIDQEVEIYQALVLGTRDYIRKNGFEKVLIGLSGGIDSALVARIAVDALGAQNVVGVTMPFIFTSAATRRDALLLAKTLGIHCHEIPIHGIVSEYALALKDLFKNHPPNIAEENLQARIRGNLLMALSNKFGYLVLTTGNKSEMATGYCTLYGDMAGGFAVIKDVPKSVVFQLAKYRNRLSPKNSIPVSIIRRAPSAELKPNQKDQDTLPPYELLDRFLEAYIEKDMSPKEIVKREKLPKRLVVRMARFVDRNEYKRRQAPPGVKITPKAFGRDRRMPLTQKFSQ